MLQWCPPLAVLGGCLSFVALSAIRRSGMRINFRALLPIDDLFDDVPEPGRELDGEIDCEAGCAAGPTVCLGPERLSAASASL